MNTVWCAAAVAVSYVLGSIPTGLWLGLRLRGVDIREHGSRNIGATNTLRVLGRGLGALALAGDMLKGAVPVLAAARLGLWPHLPLACGVAAIFGHTFSVFLRFRGGKGVATGAGVFLALAWLPALLAGLVFAAVVAATRMVSAGSCSAAIVLAVAALLLPYGWPVRVAAVLIAALVVWKHRANIQRILKGEESRISFSSKREAGPK
ncbi:MAG: glycerol-3-phosphate 1-O-acyltransferase PlsY [Candidatus Hydrogenedentes bacterium]|nr:glycerol-3-phosphate 1-O-acyltransferase PlsY [Candidatus Hydrogenedentota bacterium]